MISRIEAGEVVDKHLVARLHHPGPVPGTYRVEAVRVDEPAVAGHALHTDDGPFDDLRIRGLRGSSGAAQL